MWKKPALFVVSFPKSGRTWLRFMLEQYGNSRTVKFIHGLESKHPYESAPEDIHTPNSINNERYVLLVRDPQDVIVSSYFELLKRGKFWGYGYTGDISQYIREPIGSYETLLTFMQRWVEFCICESENAIIVRYEDTLRHPAAQLQIILRFFKFPIDRDKIFRVIDVASFENMHRLETNPSQGKLLRRSNIIGTKLLRPGSYDDPESFKTRRGGHGNYIHYLSKQDCEYMRLKMREFKHVSNDPLGYESPLENSVQ